MLNYFRFIFLLVPFVELNWYPVSNQVVSPVTWSGVGRVPSSICCFRTAGETKETLREDRKDSESHLSPSPVWHLWFPDRKCFLGLDCPQERAKLCLNQEEVESPGGGDRMGKGHLQAGSYRAESDLIFVLYQSLCAEARVNSIFPSCVCTRVW